MRSPATSNLLFLPFLLFLTIIVLPSSLPLVFHRHAGGGGGRRILHQPLFPIDWIPPPAEISYPAPLPPQVPSSSNQPFFSASPPPPAPPVATIAADVPPVSSRARSAAGKKLAIGVSAAVAAAALASVSAFFFYRRKARRPETGTEKLAAAGDDGAPPPRRATAAPDLLYLGTIDPSIRRGDVESNGSPHRKLTSARVVETVPQPSPELRPLPPLTSQPRRLDAAVLLTDHDAFYTPQRSVAASADGESACSTVSRRSLPTMGKEIVVCTVDSTPRSWRTSPRSRLSTSSTPYEIKHAIAPPPPPPPPPPSLLSRPPSVGLPPTRAESTTSHQRATQPLPPPLASQPEPVEVGVPDKPPSEVPPDPTPLRPSSRRQWMKPTSPVDIQLPVAGIKSNGGDSSSSRTFDREEENMECSGKPRLKPLHWDKVRATSDRAMVWDQLKCSSFQLNEDMFETLFCNSTNPVSREANRRQVPPPYKQENRVLDPKKSQNIAILLRALNVTWEEVSMALLDGNSEGLGVELLETLVKMAPTKEEELKLRDYNGDVSKLGSAERFLKAVLDIPFAFKRVDAMLYRANFDSEVKYLRKSFESLGEACEELKNSRLFLKLLDAVLKTGNRMNVGTNRGQATAFKLDTLLKLVDVKGTDGKTTLLHFVVQEIIRSEGAASECASESYPPILDKGKEEFRKQGLKMVAGLGTELANVKRAAGMDSDVLSSYVSKLELGLEKIKLVLQLGRTSSQGKFFESTKLFLNEAEEEITRVKAEERRALAIVKEITEYFHGDAAKEEAHPFRIFMVVRDFLSVLDQVCKEVARVHGRTMVESARSLRVSTITSLPMLNRYGSRKQESSDEDSCSS